MRKYSLPQYRWAFHKKLTHCSGNLSFRKLSKPVIIVYLPNWLGQFLRKKIRQSYLFPHNVGWYLILPFPPNAGYHFILPFPTNYHFSPNAGYLVKEKSLLLSGRLSHTWRLEIQTNWWILFKRTLTMLWTENISNAIIPLWLSKIWDLSFSNFSDWFPSIDHSPCAGGIRPWPRPWGDQIYWAATTKGILD